MGSPSRLRPFSDSMVSKNSKPFLTKLLITTFHRSLRSLITKQTLTPAVYKKKICKMSAYTFG